MEQNAKILIEKLTNADENIKQSISKLIWNLLFIAYGIFPCWLLACIYSFDYTETGLIMNCIFCILTIIEVYILYMISKIDNICKMIDNNQNKIIVELVKDE